MKKIEVSESALESLKAMAQKLQKERDMLLGALEQMLESVTGVDQVSAVNDARAAIAACQESTKVIE